MPTSSNKDLASDRAPNRQNPLRELQLRHGARFVEFEHKPTPIRYRLGMIKEHLHTRQFAGLFDVSHMNQVVVKGARAARALEEWMPIDLKRLGINKVKYTVLLNDRGGIDDDLLICRSGVEEYRLVSNACRADYVNGLLADHLQGKAEWRRLTTSVMLALQGPRAASVMELWYKPAVDLKRMCGDSAIIQGYSCHIWRAGYTGEDGFEISIPDHGAADIANSLIQYEDVEWCGLAARDSLRLEAGYCLYSQDIDQNTTPIEAGLNHTIGASRLRNTKGHSPFRGFGKIQEQIQHPENIGRILTGLYSKEQAIARNGALLYPRPDPASKSIGKISSGAYSPSLKCNIALAWVPVEWASNSSLYVRLHGEFYPYHLCSRSFLTHLKT